MDYSQHQQILNDVVDLGNTHDWCKRCVQAAIEGVVCELAEALATVHQHISGQISGQVDEINTVHQTTHQAIGDGITTQVEQLHNLLGWVAEPIEEMMAREQKKAAKRNASYKRRQNQQPATTQCATPDAPFYGPAPTVEQLQGFAILTTEEESPIPLASLPPEFWDANAAGGVWWSVEFTPDSRVMVAYFGDDGKSPTPAGELWVNFAADVDGDAITQAITGMGINPNTFHVITPEQQYEQAVQQWGQVAIDCLYDAAGKPTYNARPNDMPRLPPGGGIGLGGNVGSIVTNIAAQQMQQLPREQPQQPNPAGLVDQVRNAAQLFQMGAQLPQVIQQLPGLPAIGLPTPEQVCHIVNTLTGYFGLPADIFPPCGEFGNLATLIEQQLAQFRARVGAR